MSHVRPQTHEISGNLLFDADGQPFEGDRPYWALRHIFSHEIDGGVKSVPVSIGSEDWNVSLSYQKSGLQPRQSDKVDQLYEYRLNADGEEHRKVRLLVQPRLDWDDDERRPKSVPKNLGLATNVKVDIAVNVEPSELLELVADLFQKTLNALTIRWNQHFFRGQLHQYSNVTQLEKYVRIQREQARKIVRLDGILHRIFHLLAEQKGSKIVYSADNREIVGHNHQVRVTTEAISQLLPGWRTGGQWKHYHPEHVGNRDDDDPLHHPKVAFLFKKKWNDGHTVPWGQLERLEQQVEENLMNLLEWSGVPTKPGHWFVEDDHFVPVASSRDVSFYDDPTPEIERQQDSVVVRTLQRLTDSDRDVLENVALADGGQSRSIEEIAADTDWSTSTIYRVLGRLGGLLRNDDGNVQFHSAKISERVQDVIAVADRAVDAAARAVEDILSVDPRDLERAGRAWQNWLNRYAGELVQEESDGQRMKIRLRQVVSMLKSSSSAPWASEIVNYGYIAWKKAGRDARAFQNALIELETAGRGRITVKAKKLLAETNSDVIVTL